MFIWIQSRVRSDSQRRILIELDRAIEKITTETPYQKALVDLSGGYQNLLRNWADV